MLYPDQQAPTHPIFESVGNQLELAVQEIMLLKKRQILVKLPESDEMLRLQTPTLRKPWMSHSHISTIKNAIIASVDRSGWISQEHGLGNQSNVSTRIELVHDRLRMKWRDSLWKSVSCETSGEQVVYKA